MGARALVKRLPEPKPATQLIITPDTVDERPSKFALVLAIGKLLHGGFDMGDTVILRDYSGTTCNVDLDDDIIEASIVDEHDVLCVVTDL